MGTSKYYLMGQQNRGTTNYRDFSQQLSAPARPRSGIIRTWLDSLGFLNFLASTGPALKAIFGVQGSLSAAAMGGNARGANATDFQFVRESETRVASGAGSFIAGGQHNQISGANSMAAAGSHNEVSGQFCLVSGEHNEITANHASAFGDQHQLSGARAAAVGTGHVVSAEAGFAEGDGNIVSGYASHAEGSLNECEGDYSHAEGCNAKSYNNYKHAKASCGFSNPGEIGEAQYTNIIARAATEDDGPLELVVGEEDNIILMNNKMNAFRVMLVAATDDNTKGAAYEFKGLIKKDATAASTAIIGLVTKTVIAESVSDWDAAVTADTSNGALKITVTGESETMIRWVAFIEMVEVAFYGS